MKKLILFIVLLVSTVFTYSQSNVVIVNKSTPVSTVNASTAKNIYIGNKQNWDDGTKIVICYYSKDSNFPEDFLIKILDMKLSDFNKFWLKKVLSGNGVKPTSFSSEEELLKFVAGNKGAIGYVSNKSLNATVKAILEVE